MGEGASETQVNALNDAICNGWVIVDKPVENRIPDAHLGAGELEAISSCFDDLGVIYLLMDEKKGRTIARMQGIRTLGMLGILKLAHDNKLQNSTDTNENLQVLLASHFCISSEVMLGFLASLKD